jgi:hypothetical protein
MVAAINKSNFNSIQQTQTGLLNQIDGASPKGQLPRITQPNSESRVNSVTARGKLAQNVMQGGTAFGFGNAQIRTNKTAGGVVLCTVSHTLVHSDLGITPRLPKVIQVNGNTPTPIGRVFADPSKVKMLEVVGPAGQRTDILRVGTPKDLNDYFTQLAKVQPTVAELRASFSKPGAVWNVSTASRPQSYDAGAKKPVEPADQGDRSETTDAFNIKLDALPLQVKDIAQDMKSLGMRGLEGRPDSWLAIQAVGGDRNNPASPYKGLYLINKGVSGSEARPGGLNPVDSGNVSAGLDVRDADVGWTLKNVTQLVAMNKPFREALQTKFPGQPATELAGTFYRQGVTAIGFISKETAVSNSNRLQQKTGESPYITPHVPAPARQ